MKAIQPKFSLALLLSLGVLAGCSSTGTGPEGEDGMGDSDVSAVDQDGGSTVYGGDDDEGISSSQMSDQERREQRRLEAEREEQEAMRNITVFYFDFDTAEINSESRDVLVAHAAYLSDNPNQDIRLEGHADERGTSEYNLALGERRADAVKRFLVVNGASNGQIETVSYGEEKPEVDRSTDEAYAQNRRVEMIFE